MERLIHSKFSPKTLYSSPPSTRQNRRRKTGGFCLPSDLEGYANTFTPHATNSQDPVDEDVLVWTDNPRKVNCKDLVFLWGFRGGMSAKMLNKFLRDSHHKVFSEDFDVRLLDRSCTVVVFWKSGSSETFLEAMDSGGESCESLREMISEGLRAADYQIYSRACLLGLWEADLADSLESAMADSDSNSEARSTDSQNGSKPTRHLLKEIVLFFGEFSILLII